MPSSRCHVAVMPTLCVVVTYARAVVTRMSGLPLQRLRRSYSQAVRSVCMCLWCPSQIRWFLADHSSDQPPVTLIHGGALAIMSFSSTRLGRSGPSRAASRASASAATTLLPRALRQLAPTEGYAVDQRWASLVQEHGNRAVLDTTRTCNQDDDQQHIDLPCNNNHRVGANPPPSSRGSTHQGAPAHKSRRRQTTTTSKKKASSSSSSRRGRTRRAKVYLQSNLENALTKMALRRLARRAGVERISGDFIHDARDALHAFLSNVIHRSVLYTSHSNRVTVSATDVVYGLKSAYGMTLYGYGR